MLLCLCLEINNYCELAGVVPGLVKNVAVLAAGGIQYRAHTVHRGPDIVFALANTYNVV